MDKIKKICTSRMGFALLSNMITLVASLLLFRPFFEESDDVGIALLAEGAYGYREYHLIYSNTVYGRLLCALQSFLPAVRWHTVLMLLFTFVIFTAFVYLISENRKGRILSLIMLTCCFYELYVAVQFSKISAFIAIVAYIILFELVSGEEKTMGERVLALIAIVCITYAGLLRIESFLLATMLAGCYGICRVIYECKKGEIAGKLKIYFAYFAPVFAVAAVCICLNHYDNTGDGWEEYLEYQDTVCQMVDHHNRALLYQLHGDELETLGVSENDAILYITYGSLENSHSSKNLLQSITNLDKKGLGYVNADLIKAWISNIYNDLFDLNSVVVGLVLLLGIAITSVCKSKKRYYYTVNIIIQSIITIAVLFYYQYSSRWSHRIVFALLLSQAVLLVYLLFKADDVETGFPYVATACMFCVISIAYCRLGNEFDYQEYKRNVYGYEELISYMKQNKDTLFVTDVFTMIDYGKYDLFSAADTGQFDNCLATDSVLMANSPINKSIAESFGYNDPFGALSSGNDNVILVDALSPAVELTFCNEHGDGREYTLEQLDPVGNITLYKIR